MQWLSENKLPVGKWAKNATQWLIDHAGWFFDTLSAWLKTMIEGLQFALSWPPPLVVIFLAFGVALLVKRSIGLAVFSVFAFGLIFNLGYWEQMIRTLTLVLAASFVCMLVGVPVGIMAAHHKGFSAFIRPVLDLMQTLPTFVYLIPALILFGLGVVPGLVATVIFAVPAPIRLTELGVKSIPVALTEAGRAFGATPLQLLWKIELPHALPQIMAGLTQAIMLSLSMVVIAALVGAPGLGVPVVRALNTANIAKGFEAGLVIVLLAILLDRFLRHERKTA